MRSLTTVCQSGTSTSLSVNGRIARQRSDSEHAEMKMYLSKLKDLVPFMPKNRKLSKLEIIQHVIDYICDLQSELETHPEIGNFNAASMLHFSASDIDGLTTNSNIHHDMNILSSTKCLPIDTATMERLQQPSQQQIPFPQQSSSPAATRLPLVDRHTPNTILPSTVISYTFDHQHRYHQ